MDEENWHYVKISKIDNKIIKKLVNNLKLNLSEEFFLSLESLLKLGKKAEPELTAAINEMDEQHKFKKEIFNALIKHIKTKQSKNPKIFQLYHPDFEIRARAVMELGKEDNINNLKFLMPLVMDPDDSVRWAVINLLINKYLNNPSVYKKLKKHVEKESNPIIRKKLIKVFEDF
ncbi:MAG: HEAT repeat domain-containing protein [Promethearchaeota archaeon]